MARKTQGFGTSIATVHCFSFLPKILAVHLAHPRPFQRELDMSMCLVDWNRLKNSARGRSFASAIVFGQEFHQRQMFDFVRFCSML